MKFRVRIEQEDVSIKLWTLTKLINYLREFIKGAWIVDIVTFDGTKIGIERIK